MICPFCHRQIRVAEPYGNHDPDCEGIRYNGPDCVVRHADGTTEDIYVDRKPPRTQP